MRCQTCERPKLAFRAFDRSLFLPDGRDGSRGTGLMDAAPRQALARHSPKGRASCEPCDVFVDSFPRASDLPALRRFDSDLCTARAVGLAGMRRQRSSRPPFAGRTAGPLDFESTGRIEKLSNEIKFDLRSTGDTNERSTRARRDGLQARPQRLLTGPAGPGRGEGVRADPAAGALPSPRRSRDRPPPGWRPRRDAGRVRRSGDGRSLRAAADPAGPARAHPW